MENSFFKEYLRYFEGTEAPIAYHRWSAISILATFLGRNFYLEHGHSNIYPNMYIMLIGAAGARKSTAIKMARSILGDAGFEKVAADRTSKEKFLLDLAGENQDGDDESESILERNLFGDAGSDTAFNELFICADEANDFFGQGNIDFLSILGNLWDYSGVYQNRIKTGKSVAIRNPTINILAGNTSIGFTIAFPQEILGQGFFSRLLLIYSDPSGKRITRPTRPPDEQRKSLVKILLQIRSISVGMAGMSDSAASLLDLIYQKYEAGDDPRFDSYYQRRLTHLLKLSLITAASYGSQVIEEKHLIEANTILFHAEQFMPKALGEFGKARHSQLSHKVLTILANQNGKIINMRDLWTILHADMDKMEELGGVMQNLQMAGKIVTVPGGFVSKKRELKTGNAFDFAIDNSYLTREEREMKL